MTDRAAPGQQSPFRRAAVVNRVLEATDYYHDQAASGKSSGDFVAGLRADAKIRNLAGDDLLRGNVVQLGDILHDEIDPNNFWFEGVLPADPLTEKYAVLLKATIEDEIGPVKTSGICVALVNVTDVLHSHAQLTDASAVLTSEIGGPIELLSQPDGTGEQLMIVRLCSPKLEVLGYSTAEITGGAASTDYIVLTGTLGAETDSGITVVPPALSQTTIATAKELKLTRLISGWRIEPLEC